MPLVSFVARQMDLRRWFADSGASGAEQEALDQAFRHQEAGSPPSRSATTTCPTSPTGASCTPRPRRRSRERPRLQQARPARRRSWDVLLDGVNTDDRHRGADAGAFRLTYPFSPALVSTLRSLAGVMQRERTALKVMQQILVDRRDTPTIDDVIPVGDAFDYMVTGAAGDQRSTRHSAALFRAASRLYKLRLAPMILKQPPHRRASAAGTPQVAPGPRSADCDWRRRSS